MKNSNLRRGAMTFDEKRKIEQLIQYDTYTTIAKKLNRSVSSVREYCHRNGLTTDKMAVKKNIDGRIKRSPYFEELGKVLTESEMDVAVKIYSDLMKQFGNDILSSEEIQVIDFCIISALLNRALAREKEIGIILKKQYKLRDDLEKEKEKIDDPDEKDNWYDKIEQLDIRIAALTEELKEVKKNQASFIDKKEKATRAMNASRDQRAEDLARMNENWGDFIVYLKKNPEFRKKLGYDLEKVRLGIQEEYIRLAQAHQYADGEIDYPILNSEVVCADNISTSN